MNKRDYIWVAIRIFGIYLLVRAVIAIPQLLSSSYQAYACWELRGRPVSADANAQLFQELGNQMLNTTASQALASLCQVLLFGLAGYYLIRGGKWLFNIICPPEVES